MPAHILPSSGPIPIYGDHKHHLNYFDLYYRHCVCQQNVDPIALIVAVLPDPYQFIKTIDLKLLFFDYLKYDRANHSIHVLARNEINSIEKCAIEP